MTSAEFRDQLASRAVPAGLALEVAVVERLEIYFRLLARWNAAINLTALPLAQPTDETFDRLLIEPLAAGRLVADSALRWFDLGSGGGSPAIPLKILRTQPCLTMVEAKERKAAFLREAVRVLGLADTLVENVRFEELGTERSGTVDLVTVRAVRADLVLFETAATLLVTGGRLLWFGAEPGRIATAAAAGFRLLEVTSLPGRASSTVALLERMFHVEQRS